MACPVINILCLGITLNPVQVTEVVPWVEHLVSSSHSTVFLIFRDLNKGLALFESRVEIACLQVSGSSGKNSIKVIKY